MNTPEPNPPEPVAPKKHKKKPREPMPRAAFSISEFCKAHGMSRGTYYRLRKQRCGPREMRFSGGSMVLISEEAARDWRKRHARPATAKA